MDIKKILEEMENIRSIEGDDELAIRLADVGRKINGARDSSFTDPSYRKIIETYHELLDLLKGTDLYRCIPRIPGA